MTFLSSVGGSFQELCNLVSGDESTQSELKLNEIAAKQLPLAVSPTNDDAWISVVGVPSNEKQATYEQAVREVLKSRVSAIKFVTKETIVRQLGFMNVGMSDSDESEVWGTALIIVDASKNEILVIEKPNYHTCVDRVFSRE